jgi:hypothetical protein
MQPPPFKPDDSIQEAKEAHVLKNQGRRAYIVLSMDLGMPDPGAREILSSKGLRAVPPFVPDLQSLSVYAASSLSPVVRLTQMINA